MLSSVPGSDRTFPGRVRGERHARGSDRTRRDPYAEDELRSVQRIKSIRHPFLLSIDRVLEELAMGTSTEDIASKFHVSPHTVRTHIKNILRKLDARTRAHAVAIAFSEDAINPDVSAES